MSTENWQKRHGTVKDDVVIQLQSIKRTLPMCASQMNTYMSQIIY